MGSLSSPNLIKDVYTTLVFRKSDGIFYRDDGTNDVALFNPSILDEDNMASNSATRIASQQSIKAYVDSQVAGGDLDWQADSGGALSITLNSETLTISGGEGIDTSGSSNTLTITGEEATTSNKGVASFSSDNFAVSSGAVTIKDAGVILGTETTGNYVATAVAGEGIDVSGATGNVTISSEDATSSNKGIASFSTDNFSVSSGAVTIKDDGVILGTETSGNYVGTVVGGTGVDSTGATSGEGIAHTLSLDLNELATETTIADADFIAMVDATDSGSGKITFENLEDAIFSSVSGDIVIAEDGAATIQANSVALTTDTTGNYMVDVSAGTLIDVSHSAGEGSTATVNVDLTEAGEAAIANGDYILFLDGGATGTHAKESLADVATLFAGTGLTSTSSVLNVIGGTGITANANELTTTDSEIVHDNLSGFVANEHVDHSGVTLTAGVGLSGGGTIASNRTFTVDLNELTTETTLAQDDFIPMVDTDDSNASNKITFSNFEDEIFGNVSGDIAIAAGGAATIQANSVALGNDTTGNYVATVAGTSNEVTVSGSGSESAGVTIGLPDDVTIAGDLTVNGDTTTVNTATLSVEDPLIILASGNNAADSVDIGFYGLYDTSGSQDLYAGIFRDANDSGKFKLFKDLQAAPTSTVNTSGTGYATATLVANIEGNVTGNVTGNASGTAATVTGAAQTNITSVGTLTTLTVDNVIINGTTIGHTGDADLMTLASGVLTVAGEVDATSLDVSGDADIDGVMEADAYTVNGATLQVYIEDTVGAMLDGTETGISVSYDATDNNLDFVVGTLNQDTTGLAATATALATSRTIGGVAFDGTGNINLPGVNTAGNQNTSGTAAVATAVTITDNENTNESNAVVFTSGGDVDGGNIGLESDGDLTYNPSTGTLTATGFSGNLTGALQTASQTNVTAVGTIATGTWEATDVAVAHGGTGASSLTDGGVLLGSGTGAITAMAVLADGEMIVGDGTTDPVAEGGATLRTSIGVGTGDSPQLTAIELGHASDTTIARSSAGVVTIQGNTVLTEDNGASAGFAVAMAVAL